VSWNARSGGDCSRDHRSAVTWEVTDGIATVVLDLKVSPFNVISRAVKDEFLACFAAVSRRMRACAPSPFSPGRRQLHRRAISKSL